MSELPSIPEYEAEKGQRAGFLEKKSRQDLLVHGRRPFLKTAGVLLAAGSAVQGQEAARPGVRAVIPPRAQRPRQRLAIVTSTLYLNSHSYHIGLRFLGGYLRNGQVHFPDWDVAGMFVDQPNHPKDLSREFAREFGFRLFPTIAEALTLGTDRLAVDGVLLICEHGDYATNDRGQTLYPRFEMFGQIVDVFRRSGRTVPVFNDKHLSYDRRKAREMVQTARTMNIPLMAGSSLPVTWRRPELDLPIGVRLEEAMVVGYNGLDIYGIHALETLQCMVERRLRQGQQGLRHVQCLVGDAVWRAGDAGEWSWELLEHALGRSQTRNSGDVRRNCRHFNMNDRANQDRVPRNPAVFLLEYRDGLKAAVLMLSGHVADITFAARIARERRPVSTLFHLPGAPGAGFLEAQTMKIEEFLGGQAPYPVERTLLTSCALDYLLESRVRGQVRLETPDLDVSYAPPANSGFLRGDYATPIG